MPRTRSASSRQPSLGGMGSAGSRCLRSQPAREFPPPRPHPTLVSKKERKALGRGFGQSRPGLSGKSVITDCFKQGLQPCRETGAVQLCHWDEPFPGRAAAGWLVQGWAQLPAPLPPSGRRGRAPADPQHPPGHPSAEVMGAPSPIHPQGAPCCPCGSHPGDAVPMGSGHQHPGGGNAGCCQPLIIPKDVPAASQPRGTRKGWAAALQYWGGGQRCGWRREL